MKFSVLNLLALAGWLSQLAQGAPATSPALPAPHDPRALQRRIPEDFPVSNDEWEMQLVEDSVGQQSTWVADFEHGDMDDLDPLYEAANKYFNWVRKQDHALTGDRNLLVATFWHPATKRIYASTIPRGAQRKKLEEESKKKDNDASRAIIWRAHYKKVGKKTYHAEDSAYYNFEMAWGGSEYDDEDDAREEKYGDNEKDEAKIAVWGVFEATGDIKTNPGRPQRPCFQAEESCSALAQDLGVYYEDVEEPGLIDNIVDIFTGGDEK